MAFPIRSYAFNSHRNFSIARRATQRLSSPLASSHTTYPQLRPLTGFVRINEPVTLLQRFSKTSQRYTFRCFGTNPPVRKRLIQRSEFKQADVHN